VVIDEFASLSAQLPEFVPGLVEIAQRGRSLGFHLVLATQRPAGVVDQRIRANTGQMLDAAIATSQPPRVVALQMAQERVVEAMSYRR
jgi:S-DNA-T family DNA segregation ATPase FtsK/SpoIIIE